jgi:uncharacterized DUF497 family protein
MAIVFDPEKSAKNIATRGLAFELVDQFDWQTALIKQETRQNYGEVRLQVLAWLDSRLYAAVITRWGPDYG